MRSYCTHCGTHGKSSIIWELFPDRDGAWLSVCKEHDSVKLCSQCSHPDHPKYECPMFSHPRLGLPCLCNFRPVETKQDTTGDLFE